LTTFSQSGAYWISYANVTKAPSYRGQGECDAAHPACAFPEDLFFDNQLKTRAATLASVGPGCWYLDYSTGTVYMGDNPSGHTVEISLLGYAFTGGAVAVNISNLIIEKYACTAGNGAVNGAAGSSYWAIESNEVRFNHGIGIQTGDVMYVHGNKVHHNGQLGMGGGGTNALIQNNEISFNNASGYSFYWEAGGTKFANIHNLRFRYNSSHDNSGPGFWIDVDSQDILCTENAFSRDLEAGILSELSTNVTISLNYIWDAGFNPDGSSLWWGAGILIVNSSNVSVYFNTLTHCMNGIGGIYQNRGNAPDGQPYLLQGVHVNSNTITQATGMAAGIAVGSEVDNAVYTSWDNQFQPNTYILSNPSANYFFWLGKPLNLAVWLTAVTG